MQRCEQLHRHGLVSYVPMIKLLCKRSRSRETIDALYNDVFNKGRHELLSDLVEGPYIQHNPLFPNGIEPLVGYLKQVGSLPNQVKRVLVSHNGEWAYVHVRYPSWLGKETAGVDIYRLNSKGKILEHWDVLQAVPPNSANENSMF